MASRRMSVEIALRELVAALRALVADGLRLARCRLTGGHERGTWRVQGFGDYQHTWCRRCGWCEQQQTFAEEDEWRAHPDWPESAIREV